MNQGISFDVLFVQKKVGDAGDDGRYLVRSYEVADLKEKEKRLKSLKKSRYEAADVEGLMVPMVREYKNHGESGAFDHFVGRRVGDWIREYLQLELIIH